jgi:hypothetical protein
MEKVIFSCELNTRLKATCIMLGDGEMLKDADQRHHHDAHAQLLHDLQRRQAAVSCRVSCCIGCGISCWMGESCTLGAVQAKVPGQLEAGQACFHLQKNYLKKQYGEYFVWVRIFVFAFLEPFII